jgi:hypothetical protein
MLMAKKQNKQQLATQKENRGRWGKKRGTKKWKKHNKHEKEVGEEEAWEKEKRKRGGRWEKGEEDGSHSKVFKRLT